MGFERKTKQRGAIREVFEKASRPLRPDEVHELAKDEAPSVGISTIYRTIKGLVKDGEIIPVEVPGEPPRYEASGKTPSSSLPL